jgi:DNA-binding transcriptional ArsR family regulator
MLWAVGSNVFALLADPMRRRVVEILHGGERSVNEIVEEVDIRQSGVSRHLRILHEAGFVRVRSEGQRRIYSLRPKPLEELDAWMQRYAYDQRERFQRLSKLIDEPTPRTKRKP